LEEELQRQKRLQRIEGLQEIESFLLYYHQKPCFMKIFGVKISYSTVITTIVVFAFIKLTDILLLSKCEKCI